MHRFSILSIAAVLPLALSGVAACTSASGDSAQGPQAASVVGQPAPPLVATALDGAPVELAGLRGKVVLVDFWASWCEPCEAAMPTLDALDRQYGDALVIIGVSVDDDPAPMREFAERVGVGFALVHDLDHAIADAWSPPKMPTTFVVDGEGQLAAVQAGYDAEADDRLRAAIDAALATGEDSP